MVPITDAPAIREGDVESNQGPPQGLADPPFHRGAPRRGPSPAFPPQTLPAVGSSALVLGPVHFAGVRLPERERDWGEGAGRQSMRIFRLICKIFRCREGSHKITNKK